MQSSHDDEEDNTMARPRAASNNKPDNVVKICRAVANDRRAVNIIQLMLICPVIKDPTSFPGVAEITAVLVWKRPIGNSRHCVYQCVQ
jgi:hypothetical protein